MPRKVDPGEGFWTEDEIAEEQRLFGKDEANETLEKLFQVRARAIVSHVYTPFFSAQQSLAVH